MIIIFSKDRAFQLEACLRTLLIQCADAKDFPIRILWTASRPDHRQSYGILRDSYPSWPNIEFVEETGFRSDVISILGGIVEGTWGARLVRMMNGWSSPGIRNLVQALIRFFLRPEAAILYVVDDTVFLKPFRFDECATRLLVRDDVIAFSLRLGRNVTRFYMGNREQNVPRMFPVSDSISEFNWTAADGDFAYPLEISSSLLKTKLILSRLLRKKWHSPNTLELALANMAGRYKKAHPTILTYLEPRAVSVPLNIVQKDFVDNRVGQNENHHPDRLCALFLEGVRADLSALEGMNPSAVHVEVDLVPVA